MEIAQSQPGSAVQYAVQTRMLSQMKTQGADLVAMLGAAAAPPAGSVNLPGQGLHLDVRV